MKKVVKKKCRKCGETKPLSAFYKHVTEKDGHQSKCKACADKDGKQWAEKNRAKTLMYSRRSRIRKQYGLELEEYDEIIARGCAICGAKKGIICLDHDHARGKIRDALCNNCNRALGLFGDDPERLRKAIDYLAIHQGGDSHLIRK